MAQIIKGVSPEREAYVKGQQERGITTRGGISPQREQYLKDAYKPKMDVQEFDSEVIEAKPVNQGRTEMQNRPINSRMPKIGANPVDINQARRFASDMVDNGDYKNPALKPKLQAMFPRPEYSLGGIVNANQTLYNERYKNRPDSFHWDPGFDAMTTDGIDNIVTRPRKQQRMSIPNALSINERRDNGFDNMTTDQPAFKKGGVVKKQTETNRQRLGAINYKEGGTIKGPGTGTSDSIDADLPVGSAIIPASVLKMYGEDFFDKLEAIASSMQSQPKEEMGESHNLVANVNTPSPQLGKKKDEMKCGGVAKMKDGGIASMSAQDQMDMLRSQAAQRAQDKINNDSGIIDKARSAIGVTPEAMNDLKQGYDKIMGPKPLGLKDGGIVPAKVSNEERYMSPTAVKFFGQKFVNTLIHAKPEDVKEEIGEIKGGKVHAKQGYDPNAQTRINQTTGVDRPPVNVRPMSKEAVDITTTEQARPNIKGNPPSNVKFGQGQFDPNLVYDERAQTLSEPRNELNKTTRAKQVAFTGNAGGVKQLGGGALTQLPAAEIVKQSQASPLVQKGYGNAQAGLEQQYGRKLPILPGTMNNQTESVMNKTGELMNTKFGDLADKGKRYVNTNYPNAVGDVQNVGNRIVDDFKLGVKGIGNNMLGTNNAQQTVQIKPLAQPATSIQPIAAVQSPNIDQSTAQVGANRISNDTFDASMPIGDQGYVAPLPKATRGTDANGMDTLQVGNNYVRSNAPGNALVRGQLGRKSTPESMAMLNDTINRNADPAFQARLAEQAQIVNDRMAWAKQNDLERNARLGNPAAAATLKAQSETQQAQLGAQVEANKLAQDKELKQMELRQPKPITTNTYSPEGTLTGQDVGVVQYDKEGNPVLKKLSQNNDDKDIELLKSLPPEKITDKYNNAVRFVKELQPSDPRYTASINFLRLHNQLFPSTPAQ